MPNLTLRAGDHPVTRYFTLRERDGSTANLTGRTVKLTLDQKHGVLADLTANDEGSGEVSVVFPVALWERFKAGPAVALFTTYNNGAFEAEYPEGGHIEVEIQERIAR